MKEGTDMGALVAWSGPAPAGESKVTSGHGCHSSKMQGGYWKVLGGHRAGEGKAGAFCPGGEVEAWDQDSGRGGKGGGRMEGMSSGAAHSIARQPGLRGTHSGCGENQATRLSTRGGGRRQADGTWILCSRGRVLSPWEAGTHLPDTLGGCGPTHFLPASPPRAAGRVPQ